MKVRDLVIQVRIGMDKAARQLKQLDKMTKSAGSSLTTAGKKAGRFGKEVSSGSKKAAAGLDSVGKSAGLASRAVSGLASAAVSAFSTIGKAAASAAKSAIEFETAMADVSKVIPGLKKGTAEFDAMKESIFDLSSEIAIAPEGFAKIIAAAGQAGIAKEELRDFAEDAAKMSVAFDTTADKSGEAMAKMRTGLKLGQSEVFELAGQFNLLGQNMAVTGGQLVDVTSRVGAMAKNAGLGTDQMSALAATMIASGTKTSKAATGIKNLTLALAAGEAATGRQRVAYERLGLAPEEVAKNFAKGGADAQKEIVKVLERIKGLDKAAQTATTMQLFGSQSVGAIAPLLGNMEKLGDAFDLVADKQRAVNSINDEYATRAATTENALQLLSNKADIAAIKIGDALLPSLNKLLEFSSSPEAEAFGDALFEGVQEGISGTIELFQAMQTSLAPVIDAIKSVLGGLFEGVSNGIDKAWAAMGPFLDTVGELANKVVEALGLAGEEGEDFGESVADAFSGVAVTAIETLTTVIGGVVEVIDFLMPVLQPLASFLKGAFVAAIDRVANIIGYLRDQFSLLTGVFEDFTSGRFADGFAKLGRLLLNALVEPIRITARALIDLADAVPGGSALVPQALREFAGATASAKVRGMVEKVQAAAAGAAAGEEPAPMGASRASMQGGAAPAKAAAPAESAPTAATPGRRGGGGGRGRGRKSAPGEFVTDPDTLRTLHESPAETRQRLKQEDAARKSLGNGSNALDTAVMSSVGSANAIMGGSDRGTASVGPSVTNIYNSFSFKIDARGNEGAASNVERAARNGSVAFGRELRGINAAAMRARGGGGTAAGAG